MSRSLPQRWFARAVTACCGCLASCSFELASTDEAACRPAPCRDGDVSCWDDLRMKCGHDDLGCLGWQVDVPCRDFGASCVSNACRFDETCATDVDRFCRNDYVLTCQDGQVTDFESCAVDCNGCSGDPHCVDVTLANGRKTADCSE